MWCCFFLNLFCYFDIDDICISLFSNEMKFVSNFFLIQFSTNQNSWRETSVDSDKFKVVLNLLFLPTHIFFVLFSFLGWFVSPAIRTATSERRLTFYESEIIYRTQVLVSAFCLFCVLAMVLLLPKEAACVSCFR